MSCPNCFKQMQAQREEMRQVFRQAREEAGKQKASIAICYENGNYSLMRADDAIKLDISIMDIIPFS